MKVLVDTCIWSLVLRRKHKAPLSAADRKFASRLTDAIQDGKVVIIGPVRQEILSGIRDELQFAKTAKLLDPFLDERLETTDYIDAARLDNLCRSEGIQCGPIDMLMCSVAVRRRYLILTNDQGLLRCIDALGQRGLLPTSRQGV